MNTTSMRLGFSVLVLALIPRLTPAQFEWVNEPSNPLLRDGFRLVDPCVLYDSATGQYNLWYVDGHTVKRGVSSDGISWSMTGANQSLTGLFSVGFTSAVEVVKIGSTYYLYCTCAVDNALIFVGLATSPDGNVWTKHASSPALTGNGFGTWERNVVGWPKIGLKDGTYYMFYNGISGDSGDIGLATSVDGVTWQKCESNPVLRSEDFTDPSLPLIRASGVVFKDGLFYLMFAKVRGGTLLPDSLNLATSADGIAWLVYSGNPVLVPGASGTWSDGGLGGGTLRYIDGKYRMWYQGHAKVPPGVFIEWMMGGASSEGGWGTPPAPPELVYPPPSAILASHVAPFIWRKAPPDASSYWFELASDSLFTLRNVDTSLFDTTKIFMLPGVGTYWWRVKAKNAAGWGQFSQVRSFSYVLTGTVSEAAPPQKWMLEQNYPNPFNPLTSIRYGLPNRSHVTLTIFNTLGQQVANLINGEQEAGYHVVDVDASRLSSGVYLYRLQAGSFIQTKRMILVK